MPELTYREAIRETLREALNDDNRVFLIGEDIGAYGGAGVGKNITSEPPYPYHTDGGGLGAVR